MKLKKETVLKERKKLAWTTPKRSVIRKEITRVVAATTMY